MTWFFLLIVFGSGGVAYDYQLATSKAQCQGLEPMTRAEWHAGRKAVPGLGQIMGMKAVCAEIPVGVETERLVKRSAPVRPVTAYRPTPTEALRLP